MHVGSGNGIHKKAEAICAEEDKRNLTSSFQKQFSYYQTSLPFVLETVVTFPKYSFTSWVSLNVWICFLYSAKPSATSHLPALTNPLTPPLNPFPSHNQPNSCWLCHLLKCPSSFSSSLA